MHEEVVEAAHNSKAALIETLTKQLGAQHNEQLKSLTEKLSATETLHSERATLLAAQLADRDSALTTQREAVLELRSRLDAVSTERPLWFYVLIAALAGVILGAVLVSFVA